MYFTFDKKNDGFIIKIILRGARVNNVFMAYFFPTTVFSKKMYFITALLRGILFSTAPLKPFLK